MKIIKYLVFITLTIIVLLFIWFNLPNSIIYYSEIKAGNQFAENLKNYKFKYGKLPENNNWDTLIKLNPLKPYETFYPEYRKIDENNFELVYVEGFDPPYLKYDTKEKKWEKK